MRKHVLHLTNKEPIIFLCGAEYDDRFLYLCLPTFRSTNYFPDDWLAWAKARKWVDNNETVCPACLELIPRELALEALEGR